MLGSTTAYAFLLEDFLSDNSHTNNRHLRLAMPDTRIVKNIKIVVNEMIVAANWKMNPSFDTAGRLVNMI